MRTRTFVFSSVFVGLLVGLTGSNVGAQGRPSAPPSGPPSSPTWHWPLYESVPSSLPSSTAGFKTLASDPTRLVRGVPRPNVWGSHLGYEEYSSGVDLHPGIDIRGKGGDIVEVPLAGKVVYIQNRAQCRDGTGDKCRIFIRSGSLLYYLGHFSFDQAPNGTMIRANRDMVQSTTYASGPADSGWDVSAGDQIGQIKNYANPADWDHLHISLFDVPYLYDNLDPLRYLSGKLGDPANVVAGDEGGSIVIVDDERPFVGPLELVPDGGTVNASSACGTELSGDVDIKAHIVDTFYTSRPTPSDFPGRDTWNDTIGIGGARWIAQHVATGQTAGRQWYESPTGCSGTACGAWRARFPTSHPDAVDFGILLGLGDDDVGFARDYLQDRYPEFAGGNFALDLFDTARSGNDHSPPGGSFEYVYVLTNGAREDSGRTNGGAWETEDLPDGVHVVTVEAWDNAGNLSARTLNVNVKNTSAPRTGLGWTPIYARDHEEDRGQLPSNLGGEPFWASPDVFVARASDPQPTTSSLPFATKLVVGQTYNVYVRAHNPGCSDATNARARVWVATPGTQLENFRALGESSGVTIPAQGAQLIGPISWTPTEADLDGAADGHRCLVAQLGSDLEPLPGSSNPATFDPTNDRKIVQRNVQTTDLEFWIKNVQQGAGESRIRVELEGIQGGRVQLLIERTPELDAAWDSVCGGYTPANSAVTCFRHEGWYVLEIHGNVGLSPEWVMPGVTELDATVLYELPDGAVGRAIVTHSIDGHDVGGMIFTMAGDSIVIVR